MAMNKKKRGFEVGNLSEDLVEDILSRLPLKPLAKMKVVSKFWNEIASNLQESLWRTGIVVQCMTINRDIEVAFIEVKAHGQEAHGQEIECRESVDMGFSLPAGFWCLGSTNGLLLCAASWIKDRSASMHYVCNPTVNQWVSIPPIQGHIGMALVFDGLPQSPYKVICFCLDKQIARLGLIGFMIFSSDTGRWVKHEGKLENSLLINIVGNNNHFPIPFHFGEGKMHWILSSGVFLVYDLGSGDFKLKTLPCGKLHHGTNSIIRDDCLWDSYGRLFHCYLRHCDLLVWAHDRQHAVNSVGSWTLKYKLNTQTLDKQFPEIFLPLRNNMDAFVAPCGYSKEFRLLYFHFDGHIFAYSFRTGRTQYICRFSYYKASFESCFSVFPFIFREVDLPISNRNVLLIPDRDLNSGGRARVEFPKTNAAVRRVVGFGDGLVNYESSRGV